MTAVQANLEYLQSLPLYGYEKPYWCFLSPKEGFDPDIQRVDNLEFETRPNISIQNIRDLDKRPLIGECGFEVLSHKSAFSAFSTARDVLQYRLEVDSLLTEVLAAEEIDLNDLTLTDGPARGVHNDITHTSGQTVIEGYLPEDIKARYLKPGYRVRIINTWRSLIPELEDRPLALCDSRSVHPQDLIAADRIIPDRVGEVYYLTYNADHKWYWLEKQNPCEPLAFVMYDTKEGEHARFCPHVSFVNPNASQNASPRQSIETRSIVITRE